METFLSINYRNLRKSNKVSKKLKSSPHKHNFERSVESSIIKSNENYKIKILNLDLEPKNQNYTNKKPISYSCNINEDVAINLQKPNQILNRFIPKQFNNQEKMILLDGILIGQRFRRFSEKYDSCRNKDNPLLKQQQQQQQIQKVSEIEPKGWTNRSSQSLL